MQFIHLFIRSLLLFACILNLAGFCQAQGSDSSIIPKSLIQTFGKGELRIIEGIPFIKLSGSYYEMGKQYGSLMKDKIKEVVEYKKVKDYIENGSHPPKWLIKLCTPNRYLDFVDGISDGSGISYDEIFWVNLAPDPAGCSSIITKSDNALLLGHNQDRLLPGKYKAIIEFNPEDGLKYIISTYIGTSDLMMGMNEKGIGLCNDAANFTVSGYGFIIPTTKYMPAICKYRQILDYSATLNEVDELMEGYRSDGNILSVVSGSENDGVIYDIAFKNIRKNIFAGKNYLFATNQYLNHDLNDHPETCPRYQSIQENLKGKSVESVKDMIEILADPGTLNGVNNHTTVHSIIFDPKQFQIYLAVSSDYAAWGKWLKYDWLKDEVSVISTEKKQYDSVFIKKFKAVTIASIRSTIDSSSDQGKMFSKLYSFFRRNKIDAPIPSFTIHHGNIGDKFDIEAAVPVSQLYPDSGDIKFRIIPEMEIAYVIQKGNSSPLQKAYEAIYKFAYDNNYEICGATMQAYLKGNWNTKDPNEWLTAVRIPVKKKEN